MAATGSCLIAFISIPCLKICLENEKASVGGEILKSPRLPCFGVQGSPFERSHRDACLRTPFLAVVACHNSLL